MSNVDESDGDNWIFDSLVNFLHGNIWKMPVLGFVEEKSVVFDPDSYVNLSDEKEEEFRKIHEAYKSLVDFMLSSFMDDLQVTPEQVEEACQQREKQSTVADSHITKVALEQLQAAEDFNIFRRIMTRKNIDLQLQSLELLVSKYGVLSPSLRSEGYDPGDTTGEDDFLQVVISQLIQQDLADTGGPVTTADMGIESIQPARLHHEFTSSVQPTPSRPLPAKQGLQGINKGRKKDTKKSVKFDETTVAEIATVAPEQHRMLTSVRKALEDVDLENDLETGAMNLDMTGSEEDIEKRRIYLRAQRDKLVALKKRERERQLEEAAGQQSRPKSARAAQMAMRSSPSATTGEKSLAARRALAAVLKQELLDK
ncbi:cilia- and flagella-associated protein 36 isoform X2 [Folsomia candida]|uniref:cilia- and flagella-associated protein 36 isoform X2 n=1 Tax=Folsomia candida TaxID=158441 RepID=UPI0016053DA2|nr:cilia- and flagella-associated protein 36 isoform X2 [Folsomia candida]